MEIDIYICRSKLMNNYIPLMDNTAAKLTKRKSIKQVVLKGIPMPWDLVLKRSNNYNYTSLSDMRKILKPIEEVDNVKRTLKENKRGKGDKTQNKGNPSNSNDNRSASENLVENWVAIIHLVTIRIINTVKTTKVKVKATLCIIGMEILAEK